MRSVLVCRSKSFSFKQHVSPSIKAQRLRMAGWSLNAGAHIALVASKNWIPAYCAWPFLIILPVKDGAKDLRQLFRSCLFNESLVLRRRSRKVMNLFSNSCASPSFWAAVEERGVEPNIIQLKSVLSWRLFSAEQELGSWLGGELFYSSSKVPDQLNPLLAESTVLIFLSKPKACLGFRQRSFCGPKMRKSEQELWDKILRAENIRRNLLRWQRAQPKYARYNQRRLSKRTYKQCWQRIPNWGLLTSHPRFVRIPQSFGIERSEPLQCPGQCPARIQRVNKTRGYQL